MEFGSVLEIRNEAERGGKSQTGSVLCRDLAEITEVQRMPQINPHLPPRNMLS